jgi:DMSO/TMAO reductase YedYZ molybdopterin-dependent catalytic subunit
MNGEPLPFGHGYPARLLVPGLYGYDANTKWLSALELTRFDRVADYWTRRGWPPEPARVRPGARIDVPAPGSRVAPGPVTVAGVAWAPPRGVGSVEVSVDGGPWRAAELTRPLGGDAWRQWRVEMILAPGPHELRARVDGMAEGRQDEPPFPRGAAGVHTVSIGSAQPLATARARVGLALAGGRAWRQRGWPRVRHPTP